MAIKIVKRGKKKEKIYDFVCKECDTIFTALKLDCEYRFLKSNDPREKDYLAINCPVCNYECSATI